MNFKKPLIGFIAAIAVWQFIAWLKLLNPIYFASPVEVALEAIKMFRSFSIFIDFYGTLFRILISIAISAIIGIPAGIALGYFSGSFDFARELVDFFRSIPPIVIYPLLLIVLGAGDSSRIGVALFGSILVLILIISKGLAQQSTLKRAYFKSLGAKKRQILNDIVKFEALPHIMVGLRTVVSLTVIIIIVTEMLVGAEHGLGTRLQNVQITSNIPDLYVTIIIIGIIGVLLNKSVEKIDKKLVFWKT